MNCKYNFYTCSFKGQASFCSECEDGSNYQETQYISWMLFDYIKADQFFPNYCPQIKSYKHKIRGKNGRGNPVEFSDKERKEINKAVAQMVKDHRL